MGRWSLDDRIGLTQAERQMAIRDLGAEECLERMASAHIGRIAISHSALPSIIPVNFALIDRFVYFGAMSRSILAAATERSVVAFQTDSYDIDTRSGWTVVGVGSASWVIEDREIDAVRSHVPVPWTIGHLPEHLIKVELDSVSGHAVAPLQLVDP